MPPGAPPGAPRGPLGAPPAPGRPRERPGGSPGRPLGEPIWVKNGLEIRLGRVWKFPKFFFGPGGRQERFRSDFWTLGAGFCAFLASMSFWE